MHPTDIFALPCICMATAILTSIQIFYHVKVPSITSSLRHVCFQIALQLSAGVLTTDKSLSVYMQGDCAAFRHRHPHLLSYTRIVCSAIHNRLCKFTIYRLDLPVICGLFRLCRFDWSFGDRQQVGRAGAWHQSIFGIQQSSPLSGMFSVGNMYQ